MSDIVFTDLKGAAGLADYIARSYDVAPQVNQNSILINATDAARLVPGDALIRKPQYNLSERSLSEIASNMFDQIPPDLLAHQPPPPDDGITIPPNRGVLSDLIHMNSLLAVVPNKQILEVIENKLLPLMIDGYNASFVTGVALETGAQQQAISITKIALLSSRYDQDEVRTLVASHGAMSGALPNSLEYLAYIDCLTRLSPIFMTLPSFRSGCSWHFQGDAMWQFNGALVNSELSQFSQSINPLAEDAHLFGFHGLKRMNEENVWRYLKIVIEGVNRLIEFMNDFRNFTDANGHVDLLKKTQTYSAIRLIFADIAAINLSTESHSRISHSMSALDKFSNLKVILGSVPLSEAQAMQGLASNSQRVELIRITESTLSQLYPELCESLKTVMDRCFDELHTHLGEQSSAARESETERLNRLWSQRNIRHGSFLRRNQFESLFFESSGTVPVTISSLPIILMLGMILSPEEFLQFVPSFEN